jgi:hypothetical protein
MNPKIENAFNDEDEFTHTHNLKLHSKSKNQDA